MKANELRIGNAIWDDTRQNIKWVNHRVISDLASNNNPLPYLPIPLTEEWLKWFGFVRVNGWTDEWLWRKGFGMNFNRGEWSWNDLSLNKKIQHVHQLQNLYFALTGEELTLTK